MFHHMLFKIRTPDSKNFSKVASEIQSFWDSEQVYMAVNSNTFLNVAFRLKN